MAKKTTTQSIVLEINSQPAGRSLNQLENEVKKLTQEWKKAEIGSERYHYIQEKLIAAKANLADLRAELRENVKAAQSFQQEFSSVNGTFADMKNKASDFFTSLLTGQITFKQLGSTIKLFAAESWAAISSIPLVGWLAAVAAGIGLVIKEAIDYNKEIGPLMKLLDNLGLDKKIIPQLRALKDAFGVETEAVADMLDNLVDAGIVKNQTTALNSLKVALAKAPDKAGLISYLNSSAETAKKLGLSFEQIINIRQDLEGTPMDPQKVFGAMDTYVSRILSQSEKIEPTLSKSFGGDFAKKFYKDLESGSMSYSEGLKRIYDEGEKLKISDKERADIAKAMFGKSGASAYAYNEILKVVSESQKDLSEDLTESQQRTLKLADAYQEMETKKDEAFNSKTLRAFMFDIKVLWINAKAWFFEFVSGTVNGWKMIGMNAAAAFNNIPKYAKIAFVGISKDLLNFFDLLGAGKDLIKDVFTFNWENIDNDLSKIKSKFQNSFKGISDASKQIGKDFGVDGAINQNTIKQIAAANKLKADALDEIEKREANRETPEKAGKEKKGKKEKDNSDKKAAERKKALEQIEKDEEESHKKLLDLQQQYQDSKTKLIEDEFLKENQAEIDRRNKEEQKSLQEIAELENKKLETKSLVAKANIQKSIDTLHEIEKNNEEAHRLNMLTIQQKWDAKMFEKFSKYEQKKIENDRRLAEDKINEISTMEDAKLALSKMEHLKLTDQELSQIQTLEDAKRALRENADRAMLQASLVSLEAQKGILEESLKGLTGPAAEELQKNLDELTTKITQLKSAINGGNEADAKKVKDEQDAAKSNVDILGFSAKDWENAYKNLDTTAGKVRAIGMAIQALSNAFQMFAQMQENANKREMTAFQKNQDQKKKELLKELNQGFINQEEYHKKLELLDAQKANKEAELAYKTAKMQRAVQIANAIANTALAVATALTAGPIAGPILAGIVGALGAIQVGIIASQPLPERPSFAEGGFTPDISGRPDETGEIPVGYYKLHRKEWVAPRWMREDPRTADTINWLESVRKGGKNNQNSFADGGNVEDKVNSNINSTETNPFSNDPQMVFVLSKISDFLEYLKVHGVDAWLVADAETGKQAKKAIKEFEKYENRAAGK